jgi:hypothetical protein
VVRLPSPSHLRFSRKRAAVRRLCKPLKSVEMPKKDLEIEVISVSARRGDAREAEE